MDELTRERYADWDQPRPKRKLPWADWKVIEERRRVLDEGMRRPKPERSTGSVA